MKMQTLKAQLEKNIASELHAVQTQAEMLIVLAGSVYDMNKKQRSQYRNLVTIRDSYRSDLEVVKSWTVDDFVKMLHVDRNVHVWLGWN